MMSEDKRSLGAGGDDNEKDPGGASSLEQSPKRVSNSSQKGSSSSNNDVILSSTSSGGSCSSGGGGGGPTSPVVTISFIPDDHHDEDNNANNDDPATPTKLASNRFSSTSLSTVDVVEPKGYSSGCSGSSVFNAKQEVLRADLSLPHPPPQQNNTFTFLHVQSPGADVCRICHCGINTLATPTPLILTPICSPKKLNVSFGAAPSSSRSLNPNAVSLQLKEHHDHHPSMGTPGSPSTSPPPPPVQQLQQPQTKSPSSLVVLQKQKQIAQSPDYNLISPCVCSGSLKYVHQCCLQHWIRASNNTACELCKHPYELRSTFKPIWKWESLPMSPGEKKRVVCSALFHTVALACVVWSLYVLIDRTVEELTHSDLEWQFWTKIIVEAIGCLGAGILTYVWGKSYVSLFIKWITFNRSFVILGKENRSSLSGGSGAAATQQQLQPPPPPPPSISYNNDDTDEDQQQTTTYNFPCGDEQSSLLLVGPPSSSAGGDTNNADLECSVGGGSSTTTNDVEPELIQLINKP